VVFFPVVFISGLGRFLFSPLALSVAFAMAASYVLALTLIPAYSSRFLHPEKEEVASTHRRSLLVVVSSKLENLKDIYERWLRRALARKKILLATAGLAFVGALALYPLLGKELFPPIDAGQFTILIHGPSGMRIELSEDLAAKVEKAVRKVIPPQELNTIVTNTGVLYDWPAAYTPNAGPMDSFMNVQLAEDHAVSAQEYVHRLRKALPGEFPGVGFAFDTGGLLSAALNYGLPSPIDIQVSGNSLEVAQGIARKFSPRSSKFPAP